MRCEYCHQFATCSTEDAYGEYDTCVHCHVVARRAFRTGLQALVRSRGK